MSPHLWTLSEGSPLVKRLIEEGFSFVCITPEGIMLFRKPKYMVGFAVGWCVGRNPLFVFCGIRLIGLPAPQVGSSLASVCPFHLQDGRFIVSIWHNSAIYMRHWHLPGGRSVSVP
jgi:hypothetical protein